MVFKLGRYPGNGQEKSWSYFQIVKFFEIWMIFVSAFLNWRTRVLLCFIVCITTVIIITLRNQAFHGL